MKPINTFLAFLFVFTGLVAQDDFYELAKVQEIRIDFAQDDWRYLLDSLRYNGDELLEVEVQINGTSFQKAGLRYRDGRSFVPGGKRNGLYIDLGDDTYGSTHIINLSSALRDPSLVREVVAYEMMNRYLIAPRANFAKVSIGDEFYGLFVNVEPVEKAFLKDRFGSDQGALFYAKARNENSAPDACVEKTYGSLQKENDIACLEHNFVKQQGDWQHLLELSQWLHDTPARVDEVLDVDAVLWMLAFNNLTVNLNSYSGQFSSNYYLYHSQGKLVPIIGDLNLAFGSFKNTGSGSDLGTVALLQLDPFLHATDEAHPLISLLLTSESNRRQYLSHLRTLLYEEFLSGRFSNRVTALQEAIRPIVKVDENWYYSYDDFIKSKTQTIGKRSKIPGLLGFMEKRSSWLKDQPDLAVLPPTIRDISVAGREKFSRERMAEFRISATIDNYPKNVYLHYWLDGTAGSPQVAEMLDDGQHQDGEAGDGVFGAVVRPGSQGTITYYIRAENAKSAGFSPERYRFEHHSTSLQEINQ